MGNVIFTGGGKLAKASDHDALRLSIYRDVITKMEEVDSNVQAKVSLPPATFLLRYWLQCVVALIETPFHLSWHLILFLISKVAYYLVIFLAIVVDLIMLLFTWPCHRASTYCRRDSHAGDAMLKDNTELTSLSDVEAVVETPAVAAAASSKPELPSRPLFPASSAAKAVGSLSQAVPSLAPVTARTSIPNLVTSLPDALYMCLGRTIAHHSYLLHCYFDNTKYLIPNVFPNCCDPVNLYADDFIPLKRPPHPFGSGGGGSGGVDCCEHCIRSCLSACFSAILSACTTLCVMMSPVGSASLHPQRFSRSLYFSFAGVWVAHPSRYAGPCCVGCRGCYDDYDERGQKWQREFDDRQMVITSEFFMKEFGEKTYDEVLEAKFREMIEQELEETKGIEAMERGGGGEEEDDEGDEGDEGEESEGGGLVRGVVGGVWGFTKGAARIAFLPVVLPVRATVGTVRLVGSAVSGLRGDVGGDGEGGGEEAGEVDEMYYFDAEEEEGGISNSMRNTSRVLKLVKVGSERREQF
ncbi:hypothetical protein TrRE_jg12308 [Triparma retinervis]|uniref:Uncharacterized protein n=1 Tax=Triparma retinervis TaxID=2557542 RepID=A0A9W7A187_9STRA|nr:hypothetical protein TrRE_jg12308 [Triparma retinervis]